MGYDSIDVNGAAGYWFNDIVFGGVGGFYNFGDGDVGASIGLIFKL